MAVLQLGLLGRCPVRKEQKVDCAYFRDNAECRLGKGCGLTWDGLCMHGQETWGNCPLNITKRELEEKYPG